MQSDRDLVRRNLLVAKRIWPNDINNFLIRMLKALTHNHQFSVECGDLLLLKVGWYVTHTGLIRLAVRRRCQGIHIDPVRSFSDPKVRRYAFKAIAFKSRTCRGFFGYGDADPSNISFLVHGAEMRVAETRAVNRALRKAYGIGICSVEEIGSQDRHSQDIRESKTLPPSSTQAKGTYGPRLRDRLCQVIRQHELDANLVKPYAADFCGVKTLREATREQVENFVSHLAEWAARDRNALLCQLNSYMPAKDGAA